MAHDHDVLHTTVEDQLRRTDQRYTHGRRQLVQLLHGADRPVTIAELLEAGAAQSQSSLYRNLAILEEAGAVHRVTSTDDVARFELSEALSEHHHHLACTGCGSLEDLVLPAEVEDTLRTAAQRAASKHQFEVSSHRFDLVGICADCASTSVP